MRLAHVHAGWFEPIGFPSMIQDPDPNVRIGAIHMWFENGEVWRDLNKAAERACRSRSASVLLEPDVLVQECYLRLRRRLGNRPLCIKCLDGNSFGQAFRRYLHCCLKRIAATIARRGKRVVLSVDVNDKRGDVIATIPDAIDEANKERLDALRAALGTFDEGNRALLREMLELVCSGQRYNVTALARELSVPRSRLDRLIRQWRSRAEMFC
jgi:DNA-directed RNA polymerase specialized sigma24 family protein